MSEPEVFIAAEQALTKVVDQIKDDQWSMVMPPEFAVRRTGPITLREIINYHAFDDSWVPGVLAGKPAPVGHKDHDDLLGDDPKASWHKITDQAIDAVRNFNDLDKVVHLSYGDYPAREYLWHITLFRGLRVHDIAKVIGVDSQLPDVLVQGLWDIIEPHAEDWRKIGLFGPKVNVPASASLHDRLLGLTGRQP